MGQMGRKIVLKNFTWEKITEKTLKLYKKTIHN
jgi:glycosyltransferase involved in cell wall biosynthesis